MSKTCSKKTTSNTNQIDLEEPHDNPRQTQGDNDDQIPEEKGE